METMYMETDTDLNENIGILLIGHGSSLPYGSKVLYKLSEMYKKVSDSNYPVEVGFMNIEKPTIPAALNMLAKRGVTKIIAVPVFLAHGLHTKQDIPYMLGLGERRKDSSYYPENLEKIEFEGQIVYTDPIGVDPRIVDIITKKVEEALN
jgi:sirohydrochlorin cobaltochelatase